MVRRTDMCMDRLFISIILGLIVALIMNTAAAGATVRLRFQQSIICLTLSPSAHSFSKIPQGNAATL